MTVRVEKQRRFIEILITVGSLLAVFSAIVTQSTTVTITTAPVTSTVTTNSTTTIITTSSTITAKVGAAITGYNQQIIYWGVIFAIIALLTYSFFLFNDRPWNGSKGRRIALAFYIAVLGASLALLAGFLLTFAFSGAAHGNLLFAIVISSILVGLILVLYYRIVQVLRLEDPDSSVAGPSCPLGPPVPDPSPYRALPTS